MEAAAAAAARSTGGLAELGEALGRSEGTLRGALAELRAELRALEGGVERRVAEAMRVAGPLAQTVAELQRDQRDLRAQVTRLAGQLDALLGGGGGGGGNPQPAPRFASHARLALAGGQQSVDLGDLNDAEGKSTSDLGTAENGFHQLPRGLSQQSQEAGTSPSLQSSEAPLEAHAPTISLRKPHLPVTAVTKVSETFSGETVGSPVPSQRPGGQQSEVESTISNQTGSLGKTWSTSTVRTASASVTSVTKSTSSVNYGSQVSERVSISQSQSDAALKPQSPPPAAHRPVEKRRELVRSQTLPRTVGTQGRKALFEKFEQESAKGKGDGRPKLKRSQSFGVASASSIKQILLDWCRSKTIGYKHIDLQNFSTSWSDGMAFCALVHSFFPEAFDYQALDPAKRKENFEIAFTTAEKMANCDRLIEVEDMLQMGRKPDPMCVFTYVQSLYSHLRHFE